MFPDDKGQACLALFGRVIVVICFQLTLEDGVLVPKRVACGVILKVRPEGLNHS